MGVRLKFKVFCGYNSFVFFLCSLLINIFFARLSLPFNELYLNGFVLFCLNYFIWIQHTLIEGPQNPNL